MCNYHRYSSVAPRLINTRVPTLKLRANPHDIFVIFIAPMMPELPANGSPDTDVIVFKTGNKKSSYHKKYLRTSVDVRHLNYANQLRHKFGDFLQEIFFRRFSSGDILRVLDQRYCLAETPTCFLILPLLNAIRKCLQQTF